MGRWIQLGVQENHMVCHIMFYAAIFQDTHVINVKACTLKYLIRILAQVTQIQSSLNSCQYIKMLW